MPAPMTRLRDEHDNVEKLLKILESQSTGATGGRPDYGLMEDIAEYFLTYPDAVHHPCEDMVYVKLAERRPDQAREIGDLVTEHGRIADATRSLANTLRLIDQDGAVTHHEFHAVVQGFVAAQRAHMQKEEVVFFPAAEQTLTAEDWNAINIQFEVHTDPIFGHNLEERFVTLRNRIFSWNDDSSPC
jgi:hemerythrin-like domain-containing protein